MIGWVVLSSTLSTNMTFIYDQFGRKLQLADIRAVEHLETLKEKNGNNIWPVIEECLKVWTDKHPQQWKSYLIDVSDLRETRKEKKFASTTDKITGGILRYTLDIPEKLIMIIRAVYTPEELAMNKEFFTAFARKFPAFMVAEKL